MKLLKFMIVIFALIGLVSSGLFLYQTTLNPQSGELKVLGENNGKLPENTDKNYQDTINTGMTQNNNAVPTLEQTVDLPMTELVNCWKSASDGSYQYNFGQISREECTNKIKALQKDWEKSFSETLDKQTEMNDKSNLILPQDLIK